MTSDQHQLTIGIPVHNGGRLIERALAGLLEQTRKDFVITVSENASTDDTWAVLQEWAARDSRIILYRQQTLLGVMENFRYLLDRADTEYFMWHAHDDYVSPNYVEELLGVLESDRTCVNAGAVTRNVDDEDRLQFVIDFPDLSARSGFERVKALIGCANASWVYGVFRTDYLRQAYGLAQRFGYVWVADRITLLPAILADRIRGSNAAYLGCLLTDTSAQLYRPSEANSQFVFSMKYIAMCFRILMRSPMPLWDKIRAIPHVYRHAKTTRGLGPSLFKTFRRWVKSNALRLVTR